jgi:hypothetical protein
MLFMDGSLKHRFEAESWGFRVIELNLETSYNWIYTFAKDKGARSKIESPEGASVLTTRPASDCLSKI